MHGMDPTGSWDAWQKVDSNSQSQENKEGKFSSKTQTSGLGRRGKTFEYYERWAKKKKSLESNSIKTGKK